MKRSLYLLILLLPAFVCRADQLAYLSESQAIEAVEFLNTQKQLILWCTCCNNEAQQFITVSNVGYKYTGYENFYEVYVDGTDNKGSTKNYNLDLAYVHYLLGKKAYCVGKALGLDCDPCTAPFYPDIKIAQKLPKVEDIDIAKLFGSEKEFLGMLGDEVQRMGIVFLSTKRIDDHKYEVIGKSKVKNNICDFKGIIEAQYVVESGLENWDGNNADGKIIGKYNLAEDKKQSGTGVFEGTFEIYWTDNTGKMAIAEIWYTASPYTVLFDGTWKSYRTGASKKACWSDYRACFPAGFNVSDGPDLIPDEKYRSKGWGYLIDMFSFDEKTKERGQNEYKVQWEDWWK
ncbi:MAG: hypothetical protein FWF52_08335 [Candidatus Azobacteroides sp.]|nr:hypothetical protein [Candidatus Azobacteroides sp.]